MEKLKLYTVTKASTDKTFQVGDLIWLSQNGDLNSTYGVLSEDEWNIDETNDFECEICKTHYLDVFKGTEMVRRIPEKAPWE